MSENVVSVDDISEDAGLSSMEKETSFTWAKDQNVVHVHTDMAGVARRLIQHPEFELEDYREVEGDVVDIRGTIPVGCLSVGMSPRKSGSNADVITSSVLRKQ